MSKENLNEQNKSTEKLSTENAAEPLTIIGDDAQQQIESSAVVDEIIEFYKDLPPADLKTDINDTADKDSPKIIKKLFDSFKSDAENKSYSSDNSEEIHDTVYGLNKRNKIVIRYGITALLCAAIISGSFGLASILPGDENETEKYADELRKNEKYTLAKTEYDNISSETKKLRDSVAEKKEKADNAGDFDNIQADIRLKINDKQAELNELNKSIAEKRTTIDTLNEKISANSATELTMSPGRYVVGNDIPPGKYRITGTGTFTAASGAGKSKYNQRLGSDSPEIILEQGDNVKFDSSVKLTPLNW